MSGKGLKPSLPRSFLEQVGAKNVQFVVQIVLTRILRSTDFGLLAILLVVAGIIFAILNMILQTIKVALGVVFIGGISLLTHDVNLTAVSILVVVLLGVVLVDTVSVNSVYGRSPIRQVSELFWISAISLISLSFSCLLKVAIGFSGINLAIYPGIYAFVYIAVSSICNLAAFRYTLEVPRGLAGGAIKPI